MRYLIGLLAVLALLAVGALALFLYGASAERPERDIEVSIPLGDSD